MAKLNMEESKGMCVQCDGLIKAQTKDGNYNICDIPECPNYGLLQARHFKDLDSVAEERQKLLIRLRDIGNSTWPKNNLK